MDFGNKNTMCTDTVCGHIQVRFRLTFNINLRSAIITYFNAI